MKRVTDYKCPECGSERYRCLVLLDEGTYDEETGGRNGSCSQYECLACGTNYIAVHPDQSIIVG